MARELKNVKISHVSYVDKGANQKKFFLTKADDKPTFEKQVKILTKADDAQKLVYGIVYEPNAVDAHDDFMNAEEIEKAAHSFMKDARNIDLQHNFEDGYGDVVESYIAPQDFEVGGENIVKGSWVLVTKASDEVWEAIQKGDITGYSMAGVAETVQKESEPSQEDNLMRGFFNAMKTFFSGEKLEKGDVKDRYNRTSKARNFWAAMDSFESTIRSYNWTNDQVEFETDETKIRDAIQDFVDIMQEILLTDDVVKAIGPMPEGIFKAGKKISSANMNKINAAMEALQELKNEVEGDEEGVKKEEIQKMIEEGINKALEPVTKKLDVLEKGEEPVGNEPTELKAEDIAKMVGEAVEKAVKPLDERLDAVEKARGISKQQDGNAAFQKQDDGPSYLSYFK